MVHDYSWINLGFWPFLIIAIMVVGFLLLSIANIIGFRLIWFEAPDRTTAELAEEAAAEHARTTSASHQPKRPH